ncbi:MAG: T9SS type A sorting domain-containing protein [Bacteroidales bacterium]|nr:T9SS type A sorting domain-containing protein [Bacteroidales bacterium]
MRIHIYKITALFVLVLFCLQSLNAQFQYNKEKYWIYKERLKNYMITTEDISEKGFDIPGRSRTLDDQVMWSDEAWMISYYIATLAMEYDLLIKSGLSSSSPEVMQTKKELFFAINAINRLDWEAEQSWSCSSCTGTGYCPNNINGFMIRDDVPKVFALEQAYIDKLNESWVPIPEGKRVKCINSSYEEYIKKGSEMSQDHLAPLLMGFAFVKRFLPPSENWQNSIFSDGTYSTTSFVEEVQLITKRIIDYLVAHDWTYWNSCMDRCVYGTCNSKDIYACFSPTNRDCGSDLCNEGGALAFRHAIGFAASSFYITQGSSYSTLGYLTQALTVISYNIKWTSSITLFTNLYPLVLAAVGGYGAMTFNWFPPSFSPESDAELMERLVNKGISNHWEFLPLMYNILHNTNYNNPISLQYYLCLLDAAPCRGNDTGVPSTEWNASDRIGGDRDDPYSDSFSRLDYMFYFNLIAEAFYSTSYDFSPIPIDQLALYNIHKENITEYDKKNFMAANEITAMNYNVKTDPAEGQGRVTFVAGEEIVLMDGFQVEEGADFHGYIDNSVNYMACIDPTTTDCSYILDNIAQNINLKNMSNRDSINNAEIAKYMSNIENNTMGITSVVSLNIYPNPNNGHFTLETNINQYTVNIVTASGINVYSNHFDESVIEIDLSFLSKGIYICSVGSEFGNKSLKLVIQ